MASNTQSENGDVQEAEFDIVEGENGAADLDRAAIDMQVSTAKEYPRSIDKSLKEAETLATKNEDVASSCFYAIPRGGGTVKGPSVRLAEIMTYCWGNLRAEADIIDIGRKNVTAMGTAFDLEKNVAVRKRVKRNILTSDGDRYSQDMIGVTSNAAMSIAFRNAVFSVIPQPFVQQVYQEAQLASIGKQETFEKKLQSALEWFEGNNVSNNQVFELLEVNGPADVDEDDLIDLRGLVTAIKDGETTIDQVFSDRSSSPKSDRINEWAQNGSSDGEQQDTDNSTSSNDEEKSTDEDPQEDQQESESGSPGLTKEEKIRASLEDYTKEKLKKRCDERDLKVSGNKDELIDRLVADELSDDTGSDDTASNESDSTDESPDDSAENDESEDEEPQDGDDVEMNDFLSVCQPYLNDYISIAHMKSTIEVFGGTKEVLDAMDQYLEDVENGDVDLEFGENNELPISNYIEGGQ